jgi:predicted nucleotide-binding protein (sugar kinase/HSP70/actin superfamily)
MANSFSASFPEVWAKEQQEVFYKENVAMKIANYQTGLEGKKFGDTLNRVYRTMSQYADIYTGADTSIEDLTDTAEQLIVNKKFSKTFYVDAMDDIQSAYSEAL